MTKLEFVNMDDPQIGFSGASKKSETEIAEMIVNGKNFTVTNENTKAVFLITPAFMSKYLCVFVNRVKPKE